MMWWTGGACKSGVFVTVCVCVCVCKRPLLYCARALHAKNIKEKRTSNLTFEGENQIARHLTRCDIAIRRQMWWPMGRDA